MTSPAQEIERLAALRDAGELTEAEFARAKDRILRPAPAPQRAPWSALGEPLAGMIVLTAAIGVLIGGTALIAMTQAGALALVALALVSLLLIGAWLLWDNSWF